MQRAQLSPWTKTGFVMLALIVMLLGCKPAADQQTGKPAQTREPAATEPAVEPEPAAVEEPEAATEEAAAEPTAALPAVPLGLPPVPVPADNPMTAAKVELGKMLYFDRRVSKDGTLSCATCHDPQMAWAENRPTSAGIKDVHGEPRIGDRNSPTVINAAYATSQFWDGREPSLEAQAVGPVGNPIEMGNSMEQVVADLSKIPEYERRFQEVFGTGVTEEGFAKAIAAFERTILSGNSPYDKYQAGDKDALTEAQQRGLALFEDNCSICHAPPLMSNYRFFNTGVGMDKPEPDQGRMKVTGNQRDLGKFRVPALREVANTAPYFHDGSAETLQEAVALMAGGGQDNPNLSTMMKMLRGAELGDAEQADLVALLHALSGEYPVIEAPELPK